MKERDIALKALAAEEEELAVIRAALRFFFPHGPKKCWRTSPHYFAVPDPDALQRVICRKFGTRLAKLVGDVFQSGFAPPFRRTPTAEKFRNAIYSLIEPAPDKENDSIKYPPNENAQIAVALLHQCLAIFEADPKDWVRKLNTAKRP